MEHEDWDADDPHHVEEVPFGHDLPEDAAPEHHDHSGQHDPDLGADSHELGHDYAEGWEDPAEPYAPDDGWHEDPFPPALEFESPPEPVDGFPWSDPQSLGSYAGDTPTYLESPPAADLFAHDGVDVPADADPWAVLTASEDPATSALARWWQPGG